WTKISSSSLGVRYQNKGYIFSDAVGGVFVKNKNILFYILGLLGTKLSLHYIHLLNPSMNINIKDISRIPFILDEDVMSSVFKKIKNSISISKLDWDSRETSWNFKQNPLIKHKTDSNLIENAYQAYTDYWREQFLTLHQNEEELNKIFINIYGLKKEMTSDVELDNITILDDEVKINEKHLKEIKKREEIEEIKGNIANPKLKDGLHTYFTQNDKKKLLQFDHEEIVKQFVSYAVGCMLGRYSLDGEGLVFAGGEFDQSQYQTFKPDDDAIIPVLEDTYFKDDIVTKFVEFVKTSFGKENLTANLNFIAKGLSRSKSETAKETIRKYFIKKFYKEHIKRYNKKPIYWLFSSGKEKAFNALVYLHRYNKYTIGKLRINYLHELQGKYEIELQNNRQRLKESKLSRDKTAIEKRVKDLNTKLDELKKYDQLLRQYANRKVELDLDDGVDVNYSKLEEILGNK
ncbi:MAG: class I SAM-dependent DNA methyltransferase, partial [Patescibacteria group bacterium]|nr:class I SAM-dependent DNA methyltransferase [Patescibacteria group bacterium]